MELNEAIEHCQEIINSSECDECKKQHMQLKTWLEELKILKEEHKMKRNWIDIIELYKNGGFDRVEVHLKNQIIIVDFSKTILFGGDKLAFLNDDSKIIIITDGDIEEVAI